MPPFGYIRQNNLMDIQEKLWVCYPFFIVLIMHSLKEEEKGRNWEIVIPYPSLLFYGNTCPAMSESFFVRRRPSSLPGRCANIDRR